MSSRSSRIATPLGLLVVMAAAIGTSGPAPGLDAELEGAVQRYFRGMVEGDGETIRAIFHPDAQLFGIFGGRPVAIPIEAWIERIEGNPQPAADAVISPPPKDGVEWRVLAAERDGEIARLTVRDRFLGVWYTDYLTFLRVDGAWRIVNKTFTYERR